MKAAAILSGAELAAFGGSYFDVSSAPLLVVQGSADTVNVPACSAQAYNDASTPRYYLDLLRAEHERPYVDPGTYRQVVEQVTTEFFTATLEGHRSDIATMMDNGNVAGSTMLTTGATAPYAPGSCPGAPQPQS